MKTKKIILLLSAIAIVAIFAALAIAIDPAAGFGATIAMAPLAGYTRACTSSSGGIAKLYITEASNVDSFTLAGDVYSTATMVGGATFYEYQFEQDTAEFKESAKVNNGARIVTHTIDIKLDYLNAASRLEIEALANASPCGMIAIVKDANNQMWVVGYSETFLKDRPLRMISDETTTGKKLDDSNGSTLTLECSDTMRARQYTGSVPVPVVPGP